MNKVLIKDGYITTDKDITSLENIEMHKKSCDERIRDLREELNMLVIADPKTICGEDEDPIYAIKDRVKEIVESLGYVFSDYKEYEKLYDIIEEWDDILQYEGKINYSPSINTNKDDGFNTIVVKEEDYLVSAKRGENVFTLKSYNCLSEYLDDCTIDLNAKTQKIKTTGEIAIYKDNELVVRSDGGFLFANIESAEQWLKVSYDFRIYDILNSKYLSEHADLKQELLDEAKKAYSQEIVKEIEDYLNDVNNFNYKNMMNVINYFSTIFINILKRKNNIVFKNIYKLD